MERVQVVDLFPGDIIEIKERGCFIVTKRIRKEGAGKPSQIILEPVRKTSRFFGLAKTWEKVSPFSAQNGLILQNMDDQVSLVARMVRL